MKSKISASASRFSKYRLYEESVQSPDWQVDYLPQFHTWLTGKTPKKFREDFCGSARVACEWVKRGSDHSALALDLDPEVLDYAKQINRKPLSPQEQKRLTLKRADVRTPTREKFDWIGAFNFSVFEFHERSELLRYFKAARTSLAQKGTLFLEIAGGSSFLKPSIDKRRVRIDEHGIVTQAWEQHGFDPVTGIADYSIHFKTPDQKWMSDAFVYHWRIWGIRELRDALKDAGFKKSIVLWEKAEFDGTPTGEYLPVEEAPDHEFFIAYLVAVK